MPPRILADDQLRKHDIETLKRFVRHKLGGYVVATKDITANNRLFRGVRWNERPSVIDQLSYPPPETIKKLGRTNRIGQSVFYSSAAGPGVFFELRAEPGERIAFSEWRVIEPLWMRNLGYHDATLREMGARPSPARLHLTHPIEGESKANARLRYQLSRAFTEDIRAGDEYRYQQSIAINELMFDKADPLPTFADGPKYERAAGTVYPAMQMHGEADNLMLWPEFVDRSLQIVSVFYVLVEAADPDTRSFTVLITDVSKGFDGKTILWADQLLPEIQRRSSISYEDGHWLMRDGTGKIYFKY
jgi:hypothetical protein